jgi:2-alkyl-3-oxoalkanoate reductase
VEKLQCEAAIKKNVLVTGGGGFLGKALARRLVRRGEQVRSFSRNFYPELASLGVAQVRGDISDPAAVEAAVSGIDVVYHTAAHPGVWGKYEVYFRPNVLGTRNVISACLKNKVRALVHTSSPSVVFNGRDMEGADESAPYPDRFTAHYPETKAAAEKEVRAACKQGLRAVILRPHLIWGPEDNHLVPRILARAGRLARVGDGRNRVDTIYIDNAADAHLLAADRLLENPGLSGGIYFISQGAPIPLWEMVDAILSAGGLPPVRRAVSRRMAVLIGASLEIIYKCLNLQGEPPMTRFLAEELSSAHWFDITAARRDLGYEPGISTEEGLARLSAWLKKTQPAT